MSEDLATPATGEMGATPVAEVLVPVPYTPSPGPAESTPEVPSAESLILAKLRERRQKIGANAEPLVLDVPGYDGLLAIRYVWTPFKELARTAPQVSKISEPTTQAVAAAADTLVAACGEVLIRVDEDIRPLSKDEKPVRFGDPRLAEALGFDQPNTARQSAMLVFKNEYALIGQSEQVMEWLRGASEEVNETFLGE